MFELERLRIESGLPSAKPRHKAGSNLGGPAIATNDHKKPVLDLLERGYFAIFLTIVTDFKSLRQEKSSQVGHPALYDPSIIRVTM
jgi:hypothetical protein